jgi:hypothetical protein
MNAHLSGNLFRRLWLRKGSLVNKLAQGWRWLSGTVFPSIPIVGPLTRCTKRHHVVALKEFLITACFSTTTFWLTAVFLRGFMQNRDVQPIWLLYQTVSSGQLFIFTVGFLGPILIAAGDDPPRAKVFPDRTWHFLALILLALIAAGFYAMQLFSKAAPMPRLIDDEFLFRASIYVAGFSIALRYLTIVYRRSTLDFDAEKQLKEPVEEFATEFARRHAGEANP